MPPKKKSWGDIPDEQDVKDKDQNGKWIHCKVCDIQIRVRSQFSLTEWQLHTDGVRHKQIANSNVLENVPKLTSFFAKKRNNDNPPHETTTKKHKKMKIMIMSCPGFFYGKNSDLLPIYQKYKKNDQINGSIKILCNDGNWSIHSIECTGEEVRGRKSSRTDYKACTACFNFPSLQNIRFRIRRIENILHIENYLMGSKSSDTAYIAISKFLKTNLSSASPATLTLIQRCKHYQSNHKWLNDNFSKLKEYNVVDQNGKICHENWIMKFNKMYNDEPAMKDSLLDSLLKFTLSRYEGNINAPCSPKLIGFFQTLYAISPKFYRIFSQNFGGYNERTLRRFEKAMAPELPIIDCNESSIKKGPMIG